MVKAAKIFGQIWYDEDNYVHSKSNGKTKNEKDMLIRNSNDKSQGNGKQSVPGQKESLW